MVVFASKLKVHRITSRVAEAIFIKCQGFSISKHLMKDYGMRVTSRRRDLIAVNYQERSSCLAQKLWQFSSGKLASFERKQSSRRTDEGCEFISFYFTSPIISPSAWNEALDEKWKMKINLEIASFFHCWLQQQYKFLCPKIPFLSCLVEISSKPDSIFYLSTVNFGRERRRKNWLSIEYNALTKPREKANNIKERRIRVYGKQEFNFAP